MAAVFPRSFYSRDPRLVAQDLLGSILMRRDAMGSVSGKIVETEAYLGVEDAAAHSAAGLTARTAVLFGLAGHAYVYFIYGMHYCLNVSCEPKGSAGSVLIRALEPLEGIPRMAKLRGLAEDAKPRLLTSGPARLCEAFGITRERDNGKDLCSEESDLVLLQGEALREKIVATPRIGIRKAADAKLRYVIAGNGFVSGKIMR